MQPNRHKALGSNPSAVYRGVVVHACLASTWEVETEGSDCKAHLWLHNEIQANPGSLRPLLKNQVPQGLAGIQIATWARRKEVKATQRNSHRPHKGTGIKPGPQVLWGPLQSSGKKQEASLRPDSVSPVAPGSHSSGSGLSLVAWKPNFRERQALLDVTRQWVSESCLGSQPAAFPMWSYP